MSKVGNKPDNGQLAALVTGGSGFVGSHLVRRLVREGWQVHVVGREASCYPEAPEFVHVIKHVHDGSTERLVDCVAQAKPDVVFHLASLFLSQHAIKDVTPLIQSNVLFGNQLLEAMRVNNIKHLVNTGTSWQHYNNEDYNPVCLYAATKQAFEAIMEYYVQACEMEAITLKLFDTYGPDDARPKLFSLLEKAAKTQETLAMSPGEQLIDLVYIDDVLDAYLLAAERLLQNKVSRQETYAITSDEPVQLRELVATFSQVIGKPVPVDWGARTYRPREVMAPWNKGEHLPGWKPKISLREGLGLMKRNLQS
ncbi:MAG TPA: NAD(P)-dependent oxidoreductase [Gallionella sp.]